MSGNPRSSFTASRSHRACPSTNGTGTQNPAQKRLSVPPTTDGLITSCGCGAARRAAREMAAPFRDAPRRSAMRRTAKWLRSPLRASAPRIRTRAPTAESLNACRHHQTRPKPPNAYRRRPLNVNLSWANVIPSTGPRPKASLHSASVGFLRQRASCASVSVRRPPTLLVAAAYRPWFCVGHGFESPRKSRGQFQLNPTTDRTRLLVVVRCFELNGRHVGEGSSKRHLLNQSTPIDRGQVDSSPAVSRAVTLDYLRVE